MLVEANNPVVELYMRMSLYSSVGEKVTVIMASLR